MTEEGVTSDTPVTIDLNQDISLKSALNLILEPLHLSYIIKDEVLKVTSEQFRDGNIVPQTYPVADLVIPIPNFVPGPRIGMASALQEAYNTLGYNGGAGLRRGVADDRGRQQGRYAQQRHDQPGDSGPAQHARRQSDVGRRLVRRYPADWTGRSRRRRRGRLRQPDST